MYQYNIYKFSIKHDDGRFRVSTLAKDKKAAIKKICNAELCPESALTYLGYEYLNIKA